MIRALAMIVVLALPAGADDSPVERTKPARTSRPKPKPTPTPCPPWPPCPACPEPAQPPPCVPPAIDENPVEDVTTREAGAVRIPDAPPDEPGLRLGLQAWSLAGFSGTAEERVTWGGRLLVDGPLAHHGRGAVRIFARLDFSALPGETAVSFVSVESFGRSAEMTGGAYVRLAERFPKGQHITTNAIVWGGFATMREGEFLDRYLRSGGVGLRLAEEESGAEISVSYCRVEAAGYIGAGQVCIGGSASLPGTNGALVMGGDAVLNMSRATVSPQRDIFRLWLGASVGDIVAAVRGR